ncbi:MAG: hypothetical protein U0X86_000445 [Wolbachia endosymbiont of Xenopsylla cheopis]
MNNDTYDAILNAIKTSENKKSECQKYAKSIIESNLLKETLDKCKIGFALSILFSLASVVGVCLSQNYTEDESRIGMSILSVLLLATFFTTSICSFMGTINYRDIPPHPSEEKINIVAAELEYIVNQSLETSKEKS